MMSGPFGTLAKSAPGGGSKGYPAGTIFVRYPGRTEIAGPGDIRGGPLRGAGPGISAGSRGEHSAIAGDPAGAAGCGGTGAPPRTAPSTRGPRDRRAGPGHAWS